MGGLAMIRLILAMCTILFGSLLTRARDFDSANVLFMCLAGCLSGAIALSMLGSRVKHDHHWR